jgi:hypothetical protein
MHQSLCVLEIWRLRLAKRNSGNPNPRLDSEAALSGAPKNGKAKGLLGSGLEITHQGGSQRDATVSGGTGIQ